jgi:hypothetical protein
MYVHYRRCRGLAELLKERRQDGFYCREIRPHYTNCFGQERGEQCHFLLLGICRLYRPQSVRNHGVPLIL